MLKDEDMNAIIDSINNCKKCSLYKTRNFSVVGDGSLNSKILFIGEAPGRSEDLSGMPFAGRAGKILDELFESIGLQRKTVYITNILKCRPQKNRNPFKDEINACTKYLDDQIEIIKPKIIVTLGNFAAAFILKKFGLKSDKIGKIHNQVFEANASFGPIKILPLYHPAAAIYNPNKKDILLKDFNYIKNSII